ncbi:MAG: arsenic efflux protein [Roseburia sp.]|nr:arsenic efflux protein [Roseburia sp.]
MGDVFLDAFLDTLKILPFLLLMNFLIEFLEYKSNGLKANKILKGGGAPLIGTVVGVVPQCGFSVVATELYCKRRIALGTLLAVYIATSDEALPIMLSSYAGVTKLLPVLIIKICFALVVGYAVFAVEKISARRVKSAKAMAEQSDAEHDHAEHRETEHDRAEHDDTEHDDAQVHIHGCHHHALAEDRQADANTGGGKAARVWRVYLKHPLLHTATVVAYIFAVNVILGIVVYYIGEERLAEFIGSTGYVQPVLAALVGLIPNCAASVVITELYVVGGLNLGGTVAGLCVGAGIGYAVLAKQNRPIKNTVAVIAVMYVLAVALGMCVTACGF